MRLDGYRRRVYRQKLRQQSSPDRRGIEACSRGRESQEYPELEGANNYTLKNRDSRCLEAEGISCPWESPGRSSLLRSRAAWGNNHPHNKSFLFGPDRRAGGQKYVGQAERLVRPSGRRSSLGPLSQKMNLEKSKDSSERGRTGSCSCRIFVGPATAARGTVFVRMDSSRRERK